MKHTITIDRLSSPETYEFATVHGMVAFYVAEQLGLDVQLDGHWTSDMLALANIRQWRTMAGAAGDSTMVAICNELLAEGPHDCQPETLAAFLEAELENRLKETET